MLTLPPAMGPRPDKRPLNDLSNKHCRPDAVFGRIAEILQNVDSARTAM
jgi:hypothetical protein